MLNIVKHLIADMQIDKHRSRIDPSLSLRMTKGEKALAHLSKRAGRVYGGNDGLAYELRAVGEKALRTGRERGKHSLRLDLLLPFVSRQKK